MAEEVRASRLGRLAPRPAVYEETETYDIFRARNFGYYFVWFIVVAVVLWLIFYFGNPKFVQNKNPDGTPTGVANGGKALLWAVIIALIVVLIIWLFQSAF